MTVHVGSFYNPHSPVVLHVHRNTRNHASSHLEMTCKMVDQNHTSELLAAAEEENQLGLHWPFKVDFGSALRAVSSMYGRWRSWESNSTKSPRTTTTRLQFVMQSVPSVTFRTTRSTRLFAQMMRRAGCHDSNLGLSRAFGSSPAWSN